MRYQDYIVRQSELAAKEFFRYAKAVPEDKLTWNPLEVGQSVLDQCREIAMTPTWAADIIEGTEGDWSEEAVATQKATMEAWKTPDDCQAEFDKRFERLRKTLLEFPDERLEETKFLRFEGGRDFTYFEMMDYPRWNLNYHLGQVAYVQTLYGDKDMH